ncbi:hypothetical protein CAPTEDRAFT_138513 [Capitella teleta]|uniref:Hexosyltransferase n=1 Tax=Capitella teleta TaxID=283909 RepID=R7T394_CAPTE|nr:hypothetical protein CAPTEDRAFT_138513 [Capitella teleta]|eukprot:ELT87093.1 hypothetical protein CAPTEDRAFT_138513 [Capitella teleta]
MLVYVHTGADHYRRRAVIRQTWGDIKRFPNMRVLFVMGKTNNIKSMQDALQFESTAYGDILEEDFEDTYHNLTFKGIAGLKFISHYCNNVKYILKTDDDVFVNMYTLQNHLMQLEGAAFTKNLILCSVSWKTDVRRAGKWAIPKEMYTEDLYPPYCQGLSYVLSTDVAPKLYDASFFVKFFWVDDVYISGLLPKHINLKLNTMRNLYCNQREMEAFFAHPTEWYKYVFTHIHDEALFLKTWDQITKYAEKETIPTPTKISPGVLADFYESKGKLLKLFYEEKNREKKK